jgi:Bacterial archaeo-eukaryotic release factor family 3
MAAAQEITLQDVITPGDLAVLARASGPCLTTVVSIPNPLEAETRFKNAIRSMEQKLNAARPGVDVAQLTRPVRDLAATAATAGIWAQSIILFRSPDLFRCFLLPEPAREEITLEERFQVRPLLSALAREQRFCLLALSRGNVRLFQCTQHHAEEESLRGLAPQDMRAWMGTWKPDHVLDNRAVAGPAAGSSKGVVFTTSRDREREDKYVSHFFAEVDRGISPLLRRDDAPLVLAGVEEEVTIYQRVSTYPRLLEKAVNGSPDGMEDHVLHRLARETVGEVPSEPLSKTLAHFARYRDSARVSSDANRIFAAAAEGRVSDLVLSRSAELRGCTLETHQIETRDDGEDLLNAAALWTIQRGGQAFALPASEMPAAAQVAAVFRF